MKNLFACLLLAAFLLSACKFDPEVLDPGASTLGGTTPSDQGIVTGTSTLDPLSSTPAPAASETKPLIPGDLGWGRIHGRITDAATGNPIAGVTVTCEHHSYTSPLPCSGSVVTNADGFYVFETVFFHDTDTIRLTVLGAGYHLREFTQSAFTANDMEKDFSLAPAP